MNILSYELKKESKFILVNWLEMKKNIEWIEIEEQGVCTSRLLFKI